MDKSLKIIEKTAEENKGEAFEKLRNIKNNVSASLKGSLEEVSDLNRILNKYITSMTSIISPEIKSDMMLVDRNDIWINLQGISGSITYMNAQILEGRNRYMPDIYVYQNNDMPRVYKGKEEKLQKLYEANRQKIVNMQAACKRKVSILEGLYEELTGIYENKVKAFENMDDSMDTRMQELYNKYTNTGEWLEDLLNKTGEFITGLMMSAAELMAGLVNLVAFVIKVTGKLINAGVCYWIAAVADLSGGDVPEGVQRTIDDFKEKATIENIVRSAEEGLENFFQEKTDTFEEKGPMYMVGNILGDAYLAGKLLGWGKVLRKGDNISGAVDDVAKVEKVVDKASDIGKKQGKFKNLSEKCSFESESNTKKSIKYSMNRTENVYVKVLEANENVSLGNMFNSFTKYLSDRLSKIDPEAALYKMEDWYNNNSKRIDKAVRVVDIYERRKVEDGDI